MLRPRFPPLRLGVPHRGIKTPPPPSYELNRQGWLRMDPVMKWTLLVDLGRRVPLLLKKSVEENTGVLPDNPKMPPPVFSSSNVTQHASLVKELPYSVRLKLALSCLLWVRCLRDVQDTLARLRLPYTHISRFGDAPIATVYPTRWQEYWVDINSMVQIKMNTELNDTAEQVPAPHTWDPETAVTMEDAETESTIALEYSVPHGQKGRRGQSQQLLDRVQGTVSRASEDDELANKLLAHGKRRRLLTQGSGLTKYTGELRTMGSSERQKGWAVKDALRKVDPPTFEQDSRADAEYHGNQHRGEGCPVTERGLAPSTPIHIRVEEATPGREQLLCYCVMAHSAILSSLFTEGRTVRFSSNHPVVVDYVKWLFYEMEKHKFLSVSLVTTESGDAVRSYFPSWVWKTGAVVLLPPAGETYTTREVRQLASLIVRSAPCSVLVEASLQANSYAKPIESEVTRLLDSFGLARDSVSYVPVGRKTHTSTTEERDTKGKDTAEQKNSFVPRRNEASGARQSMWSRLLTVVGDRWWKGNPSLVRGRNTLGRCARCVCCFMVCKCYTFRRTAPSNPDT
ncbi:hypothetical protein AGDE_06637 [Angomonas deanei]|uniref:Uncharacterized protein n=1 Tax=Angomonas deanei TaxID=59799 RepID=A0A7G2CD82_9TRYP|nr:hypothetical protein AGDE_06637 [Angomonas deanei]CAD2217786.1 hypothetical protein, conserved [Angomonas deanei]|eukprot:EPY37296.1 hypothetical protein AGDE_06637 [Angomonas deanei]